MKDLVQYIGSSNYKHCALIYIASCTRKISGTHSIKKPFLHEVPKSIIVGLTYAASH